MLGFVFAASPRKISLEQASSLVAAVPRQVGRVGLFMDDSRELVSETLETVSLDLLQFHGSEDSRFCRSFGVPYVKALGMGSGPLSFEASSQYPDAVGFIYDGHALGEAGGSGKAFDWTLLEQNDQKTWLAGGLTPENVAGAVRRVRPWAVDVSSGVEDVPGVKNHQLMKAFITAAKSA